MVYQCNVLMLIFHLLPLSAMKTTHGLQQVKLEKDEDETSVETDEKRLLYPPRFPQPSPQSGAGSSDGIVGARLQL